MVVAGTDLSTAVASCEDKYVRLLAGPGTGKTWALMQRVRMLLTRGEDPRNILMVSFTNVAAKDLQKKLGELGVPVAAHIG